jgi:hypothetical protein
MKMSPPNSFASILAQAPAVSSAFGRWFGFALMMTALLGVVALGGITVLIILRTMSGFAA